jgi:vacuolar fusion protein MON1
MSESSYFSNDSDDEDVRKEDCALVDAISEINFDENNIGNIRSNSENEINENHSSDPSSNSLNFVDEEYDYLHDSEWINQRCHVFILSTAGKPVYSLHGSEEKLSTLFGLLQALVSVVQSGDDSIRSITARNIKFVFLVKSPLILVGVNKSQRSEQQILNQLM